MNIARLPPRLTPYTLNTPLFSDYAEKARLLYLPPGTHATYKALGALDLPVGATLVKTFAYPADLRRPQEAERYLETRLLIHRKRGWVALAYVWTPPQTAPLKRARLDVSFTDPRAPGAWSLRRAQSELARVPPDELTPTGPGPKPHPFACQGPRTSWPTGAACSPARGGCARTARAGRPGRLRRGWPTPTQLRPLPQRRAAASTPACGAGGDARSPGVGGLSPPAAAGRPLGG
jgi:hypothetical protein